MRTPPGRRADRRRSRAGGAGGGAGGRWAAPARVLRRVIPGGGAPAAGLCAGARDGRGPGRGDADRGRGVRRGRRSRVACLPRPDRPERGHVRRARACVRVLHLRHAFLREPGLPARGDSVRRAAEGRPGDRRRPAGHRAPPGGPQRERSGPGAGPALPGARDRPRAGRRRRVRPGLAAADPAGPRGGSRPARPGRQPWTPGRDQRRRRPPVAVLADRRPDRFGLPPVRAAGQAESDFTPGGWRWNDAPVTKDIIEDLSWRGLIAVSTDLDDLRNALDAGQLTLYGGFDPTAPGMHIGNLVLMLTMRRFQLAGHRPIGLIGGATGLIGDPSGKSAERVLNPREGVAGWAERFRGELSRFLDFEPGPAGALLVSNLDWTAGLSALDFLRDIGKHFPLSQMLSREVVRARLEAGGITYTEFSYQVLQANDFLELHRRYGCALQVGGSDQWGNLVSGVDLIRRVTGDSVHALATPLITKPDGTKYGKTEGDAVWLSADLMSPYAFYQFWINRSDAEVPGLLRVFTFRSREEIEGLERETADRPAARTAQRVLADDVTALVHGPEELARVVAASRALFGQGDLRALDEKTLAAALAEVPCVKLEAVDVRARGLPPVADLMAATGIAQSKSAARRAIAEGGAYLNNVRVAAQDAVPSVNDLLHGRFLVIRRGKRTVAGVEVVRG